MSDETLHWTMPETKLGDPNYACDFFADPHPVWDYPAEDFAMPVTPAERVLWEQTGQELLTVSRGRWGACEDCSTLIEADDRAGLLERQVAQYLPQHERLKHLGMPPTLRARVMDGFRASSRVNFTAFTKHRTGPRVLTGHE